MFPVNRTWKMETLILTKNLPPMIKIKKEFREEKIKQSCQPFSRIRQQWRICDKIFKSGQVKFVEDSLKKIWRDMVCLSRQYPLKFFKGCLPQFLIGPLLNTLSHIIWREHTKMLNWSIPNAEKFKRKHATIWII